MLITLYIIRIVNFLLTKKLISLSKEIMKIKNLESEKM